MADLVEVSTGDLITAERANSVKDYIHDGTHKLNTLSIEVGGVEIVDSSRNWTGNPISLNGAGVPSSTPANIGITYIDTTNLKIYISIGTSSSADWKKVLSQ